MKIRAIEGFRLYPIAIKEAWVKDDMLAAPSAVGPREGHDRGWRIWHWRGLEPGMVSGRVREQLETQVARYDVALKGRDPGNFALCQHLMEAAYGGGMPGSRAARSGVDMALYDLVGKARGLPVHALLGGAYRNELSMLTNLYHKTPDAMADACRDDVSRGFKGLRSRSVTSCWPMAGAATACFRSSPSWMPLSRQLRATS